MPDFSDQKSRQLATQPTAKLLMHYAAPAMTAMCASFIYNICDTIFLGQWVSSLAIAGLAITFPLMTITTAFGSLVNVGAGAQASIYLGQDDRAGVQRILGNMMVLDLLTGLLLGLVGLLGLTPILHLFGASAATAPYASSYMQVILLGLPITYTFQGMASILRSTGHPRRSMSGQLIAVVLNVILDPIFIYLLDWGIQGAAIATVLSQLVALIYLIPHILSHQHIAHLTRAGLRLSRAVIRSICSIGLSPFLITLCGSSIHVAINWALLQQGGAEGDLCVGAYGIINRITQVLIMLIVGLGQGMQPIVGFNLGAGLYRRVQDTLWTTILVATVIMSIGYALLAIFPAQLASLFTTDQAMIELCIPALRIALCTFPLVGSQLIAVAFFQAIRQARISIWISLSRQLLFLLPMLLVLPRLIGVNGVWISMSLADVFSVTFSWIMLYRCSRRMTTR